MGLIKTEAEIKVMKECGEILARVMNQVGQAVKPGVTTKQLDELGQRLIEAENGKPSFLGYRNFPNSLCISVNEAVVHGLPTDKPLAEGDIVGVDLGVLYKGYHTDSAWTFPVGTISESATRLLNITRESLFQGIAKAKVGNCIGDISATIQRYVESNGYSVVRELVGHGIGQKIHEEPSVPNYGKPGVGDKLKAGMTICIEPMVNQGSARIKELSDGWTIVTADRKLSAHFEHTVLITDDGPVILTG